MAKISQASSKYIVHATIEIDGVVDRPDVVGAIFGQIEGLLGADLELRELQRSGRIGRIEVDVKSKDGKTTGNIQIPSSLDKAETAIVGGALEIIERIGPCAAKIVVTDIEDERVAKRQQVITRAKELLKRLNDSSMPDSGELSSEVSESVRVKEIIAYGKEKLPCGPDVETENEIIFVEGRADVVNLLRHGFKNAISINGTSVPDSIKQLSKKKEVTVLCDGDRGGDLIIKELLATCDIDFITKAPDGKEVEELQKKEIHQALRNRMTPKDWDAKATRGRKDEKTDTKSSRSSDKSPRGRGKPDTRGRRNDNSRNDSRNNNGRTDTREQKPADETPRRPVRLSDKEKQQFAKLLKELKKDETYVLDKNLKVLGKVPVRDLASTLPALDGVTGIVVNGEIGRDEAQAIDSARPRIVVAKTPTRLRSTLILPEDLQ